MTVKNSNRIISWQSVGPAGPQIVVEEVDTFDARGKKRVVAMGFHFGQNPALKFDAWWSRDRKLYVRFWSYGEEVAWYSFVVTGLPNEITSQPRGENWIPEAIRDRLDDWIIEN